MNCKPGDLAVIVCGGEVGPHFVGRIVRCIRLLSADEVEGWEEPTWEVDWSEVSDGLKVAVEDAFLRPIRDNDGTDETLIWAGKPKGVPA